MQRICIVLNVELRDQPSFVNAINPYISAPVASHFIFDAKFVHDEREPAGIE
jgi:hypothetical protein